MHIQEKQNSHFCYIYLPSQWRSSQKREDTDPLTANAADSFFNPSALRKAKIVNNFGLSECSKVKSRSHFEIFTVS